LAQDKVEWLPFVNTPMDLRTAQKQDMSWPAE